MFRASLTKVVVWGQLEASLMFWRRSFSNCLKWWRCQIAWLTRTRAQKVRWPKGGGYRCQTQHSATLLFFCFTFLFTRSLSTLHCLGQVLFLKSVCFLQNIWWKWNNCLFKKCYICTFYASHRKASHNNVTEIETVFWKPKHRIVIIR